LVLIQQQAAAGDGRGAGWRESAGKSGRLRKEARGKAGGAGQAGRERLRKRLF
jgi:hypothetical protein